VTFDDIRKIALAWPEVEDGTSYGTPALKVRKKLLVRLKEDGDSQSAISKSGRRFCVRSRSILLLRMILSPNRSHFGGSCADARRPNR
jgi:hypothetical protein